MFAHASGPKGDVGFPYRPDEVEHLVTMLRETRLRLTDDGIAALATSPACSERSRLVEIG